MNTSTKYPSALKAISELASRDIDGPAKLPVLDETQVILPRFSLAIKHLSSYDKKLT
jgi:hypothetical protein